MMPSSSLALLLSLLTSASGIPDACGADGDEVSQLQLNRRTSSEAMGLPEQVNDKETTIYASLIAEGAKLIVDGGGGGTLIMSGRSVETVALVYDRPLRMTQTVDTESAVSEFQEAFDKQSGGYPNAVLAGKTAEGELRQVTIVLTNATYNSEGPEVTFSWKPDNETIDQSVDFEFASLFIDGFDFLCHLTHFTKWISSKLCVTVVEEVASLVEPNGSSALGDEACKRAISGVCKLAPSSLLDTCAGILAPFCSKINAALSGKVKSALESGKESASEVCKNIGLSSPCS